MRLDICAEHMARVCSLLIVLAIHVHSSSEAPPKLTSCRIIYKAKPPENTDSHSTWTEQWAPAAATACVAFITLPTQGAAVVNATDLRNCENYYTCELLTCSHCPCPTAQKFNPLTLRCESTESESQCVCPGGSTTTATTSQATAASPTQPASTSTSSTRIVTEFIPVEPATVDAGGSQTQKRTDGESKNSDMIIIAAIVSAAVVGIVLIVLIVIMWLRGNFSWSRKARLPLPQTTGYAPPMPPVERHVYAEIDERMVSGSKHWQHGSAATAPPIPNDPPPCSHSPALQPPQLAPKRSSTPANLNGRYPSGNPLVRYGGPYVAGSTTDDEFLYHSRESSSEYSYSQCSNSSNQTSIDSQEVDSNTPLHTEAPQYPLKTNYVSKQVYI